MKVSVNVEFDSARALALAQQLVQSPIPMELLERETARVTELLRPDLERFGAMLTRILAVCIAGRVLFPGDEDEALAFLRAHQAWCQAALSGEESGDGPTDPA